MMFEELQAIAEVCHEANRAYCKTLGDTSQVPWADAPEWQKDSAIKGVMFHVQNPTADASASHENWLKEKLLDGWKEGPVKDAVKKEHPCIVSFTLLPIEQQIKDHIFRSIVHGMKASVIQE